MRKCGMIMMRARLSVWASTLNGRRLVWQRAAYYEINLRVHIQYTRDTSPPRTVTIEHARDSYLLDSGPPAHAAGSATRDLVGPIWQAPEWGSRFCPERSEVMPPSQRPHRGRNSAVTVV